MLNLTEQKTEIVIKRFAGQSNIPRNFSGVCKTLDETVRWFKNGVLHREDGPAIIWEDGTKEWFVNGKRHCTTGAAYVYPTGCKEYWIEGVELTKVAYVTHPSVKTNTTLSTKKVCLN